ncbi:preprotein translocase subunit SecG [alpha proteobacterium Q-1]|nr:preprotein translocase subunit SecG [alpha proteobacterium Q-1]
MRWVLRGVFFAVVFGLALVGPADVSLASTQDAPPTPEASTPEATDPEANDPEASTPEAPEANDPEASTPEAPEANDPEASTPEATDPQAPETEASENEPLDFVRVYEAGNYEQAALLAQAALDQGNLERDRRGRAWLAVAKAHVLANRHEAAREALDKALAFLDAPAEAHYERFLLAYTQRDWIPAAQDLKALAGVRPDLARPVHTAAVMAIKNGVIGLGREDLAFDLLLALRDANYSGAPADARPDALYRDLVQMLGVRGRLFEAEALLKAIYETDLVVGMMVDRRFSSLWRSLDTLYGTAAAITARELEFIAQVRQGNSNSLVLIRQHMKDYRRHGLSDRAVQLGGAVMQAVDMRQLSGPLGAQILWVANELAYALLDIEETEAAISLLGQIAALDPARIPGLVNQQINYAAILLGEGRYQSALDAAPRAEFGSISRYGQFFIRQIAVCAYEAMGEPDQALAALGPLLEQPMLNPRATQIALLCLDDLDRAAAHLIDRLDREQTREDALLALVKPDLSALHAPFFQTLQARFEQLRRREDVLDKQAEVGRQVFFRLRPIYWGAF